MGRPPRNSQGGYVYHVVCRGLKIKPIFRSVEDYEDFEQVLYEGVERFEPRLLAYCILPKHWHMLLTPRKDGDLSKIVAWLTVTHSARWHAKPRRSGTGGLYERRFKSFPVQDDIALLDVMQFVESHPVRAGLAEKASDWQWSSTYRRTHAEEAAKPRLSSPPVALPVDWDGLLHQPTDTPMLERIQLSIDRSRPYGTDAWVEKTATKLGLQTTLRARGRPRKV